MMLGEKTWLRILLLCLVNSTAHSQYNSVIQESDSLLNILSEELTIDKELQVNLRLATIIINGNQSLKYGKRALELAFKKGDKKKIAESYVEIGYDYERINDFPSATEAILKASQYYEEMGYDTGYGIALNMLGRLCFSNQEYNKSIDYFTRAIRLHQTVKDSIQLADDYNNIGEVYRVQGGFENALYYFNMAKDIYLLKRHQIGVAYSLGNTGLVLAATGKKQDAEHKLQEATRILEGLLDFYPISVFHIEMARLSLKHKELESARWLASQGYKIAYKENLKEQMRDACWVLYEVNNRQKIFDKAIHYLLEYYANKDSISNEQTIRKIAGLQTDYEVSKREEQLAKLSVLNNRNIAIALFLATGLLLIGILTFYLFLFNKRLKTNNGTLESQQLLLGAQKEIIQQSLMEKETLLKEIHHRVKNNLQIISSLLNMQSNTLEDDNVIEIFQTGKSRIQSIALIHQKLYQNETLSNINIREYAENLSNKILDMLLAPGIDVSITITANDIFLDIDTAVPLGLIINELMTNSVKYAFSDCTHGAIDIQIAQMEKHGYQLKFSDSGPGLPEGMRLECVSSLGSKLINMLTRQLGGHVLQYNENGSHYMINFYDMVKRKELV